MITIAIILVLLKATGLIDRLNIKDRLRREEA